MDQGDWIDAIYSKSDNYISELQFTSPKRDYPLFKSHGGSTPNGISINAVRAGCYMANVAGVWGASRVFYKLTFRMKCPTITCPRLPRVDKGNLTQPDGLSISIGTIATLECPHGTRDRNDGRRTCLNNGQWSGRDFHCYKACN